MRLHRKGQNVYFSTYTKSYNWVLVILPVKLSFERKLSKKLWFLPVIHALWSYKEQSYKEPALRFWTNVVGISIEKLFDMWRNYEILKYYVICAAVSALSWLSQFCTSKKNIGIGCVKIPKFVISSFRHIFSIDMPTTLVFNM